MEAEGRSFFSALLSLWAHILPPIDRTIFLILIAISCVCALHALINKRDPKAALGWIAICLLFQPFGFLFYFFFGINRIQIQGKRLGWHMPHLFPQGESHAQPEQVKALSARVPEAYAAMAALSGRITRLPLLPGNRVDPLQNGEEAFPAMLETIRAAKKRLYLSTYILETNGTGLAFINALGEAMARGVDVRVILDGVGEKYSFPRAGSLLARRGVPTARFLAPRLFPPEIHINLRNHRKILVADGRIGYTGGMNIGDRHLAADLKNPNRVKDIHFKVQGPVAAQMEDVFLADWRFCTGDAAPQRTTEVENAGEALCRTVVDGPNEEMDKLALILAGAAASARTRLFIETPYFIPSRELVGALQTAALRGVDVRILLPEKNNLPYVKWASDNMLWELLQRGVRIFYQPPPFVHRKLFLADDFYSIIGSANIDPRSLRLNFEMVLEVFDPISQRDAHGTVP